MIPSLREPLLGVSNTLSDTPWQHYPLTSPRRDRLVLGRFPVWEGEYILASSDSCNSPLTGVRKTIRLLILVICFDPQALDLQPDIDKLNALLSCQAGPLCEGLSAPLLPSTPSLPPLRNLLSRPLTRLSLTVLTVGGFRVWERERILVEDRYSRLSMPRIFL